MRLCFVTFGCLFAFAAALNASTIGVSVNGTCEGGSCPGLPLPFSTSETLPFDFLFTLANGDMFLIDGSFTDNNNSDGSTASNSYAFQVTYEGNPTGGLSGADTITVQRDAEFATSIASADFTTSLIGAFSSGIAASSSASSCFGGTLACLGPVAPPGSFDENSATFAITNSAGAFVDNKTFVNNFGAGSPVGSYVVWGQTTAIVPPTPEPASFGLIALGLGAIILRARPFAPRGHGKSLPRP